MTEQISLPELNYFFGKPSASGDLRTQMADFKVFEQLPFSPMGEGEHYFLHIRKTGANTLFVARQLAKHFQVKENAVTYAGLKDRFAVTEQWFSVHVPGKAVFEIADIDIEGVEVLSGTRHNKKLKTGALTGNRFEITLRNITDADELVRRFHAISAHGVPNYFGEQRFGIDGGNIEKAAALFAGTKVKDKKKRGMYLSAARSHLFNFLISQRIEQQSFDKIMLGDVMMLAGTQSVFPVASEEEIQSSLSQRLHDKDIDITAPMWGAGDLMTSADAQVFEQQVTELFPEFCRGLPKFGLKQERRRIRLVPTDCAIEIAQDELSEDDASQKAVVSFFLPAGSYATTVMRELLSYRDLTQRAVPSA